MYIGGSKMNCPKKIKNCSPTMLFAADKKNFICSGCSTAPTKYKFDKVWLCLQGKFSSTKIEMTVDEAALIISALGTSIANQTKDK